MLLGPQAKQTGLAIPRSMCGSDLYFKGAREMETFRAEPLFRSLEGEVKRHFFKMAVTSEFLCQAWFIVRQEQYVLWCVTRGRL